MATKSPKHYARMIRDHVKALPGQYADDATKVQDALGLNDEEFELGLTMCIAKKIIVLEKPQAAKASAVVKPAAAEAVVMKKVSMDDDSPAAKLSAVWGDDDTKPEKKSSVWDDDTKPEKKSSVWDDDSERQKKISTNEMASVFSA